MGYTNFLHLCISTFSAILHLKNTIFPTEGGLMTTYDLFLFAGQSNMAGRGIACTQFPECAPDLIPGAGAEFRAISDQPDFIRLQSLLVLWKTIQLVFLSQV